MNHKIYISWVWDYTANEIAHLSISDKLYVVKNAMNRWTKSDPDRYTGDYMEVKIPKIFYMARHIGD